MGFGMAKNVRHKIPTSSTLVVCELIKSQRDEFTSTIEGKIETAETPKEVAEKCVCMLLGSARDIRKSFWLMHQSIRILTGSVGYYHLIAAECKGSKDRVSRP